MSSLSDAMRRAEPRPCERCGDDRVNLRRIVVGNGTVMYFWLCAECQKNARVMNDHWIKHEVIDAWVEVGRFGLEAHEDIPIHLDYSRQVQCDVCGKWGAEYHHWAPVSLSKFFGDDWYKWPGGYLCKEHHDLWHEVVTPFMHGRSKTENARRVMEWAGNGDNERV